ncbi:MAG: molybdopterin molybdotransferase MoeA [Deltaproteobacteria bacterium]|nr:molybdopterin molybdotransferase MoeA [Deltaproteobacteria bacterium]
MSANNNSGDKRHAVLAVAEARQRITQTVKRLDVEAVPLEQAYARVLANDMHAPFALPRFDNSAMDGYAVRAVDLRGASRAQPVTLDVIGTAAAGSPLDTTIGAGQCAQVMTGGLIPSGADAVVIVENTAGYDDRRATFYAEAKLGDNIRPCGDELAQNDRVLQGGTLLGAAEIGCLATFGLASVTVSRQPRLVLLATGDEIRQPGEQLRPGEIYNSNLFALAALARASGALVVDQLIVPDTREALTAALESALSLGDMICTSGGVSMGRYDHVRNCLAAAGLEQCFWRIEQQPGRPLLFAASDAGQLLFGLPGNPVSSMITFLEYAVPAIRLCQGLNRSTRCTARLSGMFKRLPTKHRFLFGRAHLVDGQLQVEPTTRLGSHMLTAGVAANCVIGVAPGDGALAIGTEVEITPIPGTSLL